MTLARSAAEGNCLRRALRRLSETGLPIFVGEGGSNQEFVSAISRLPNVRICLMPAGTRPSLVNQVQAALAEARQTNPDYLLYTFPAHWDPKLRIPRGQVVAAASIVSPKY